MCTRTDERRCYDTGYGGENERKQEEESKECMRRIMNRVKEKERAKEEANGIKGRVKTSWKGRKRRRPKPSGDWMQRLSRTCWSCYPDAL